MNTNLETVPGTWTTADDEFFRVVWDSFNCAFLAGAGVLLASYDDESAVTAETASVPVVPSPTPAAPSPLTAAGGVT